MQQIRAPKKKKAVTSSVRPYTGYPYISEALKGNAVIQ
jgi:hypothetical protein